MLRKTNEAGRCEQGGKKTCLVCIPIRTATTFTTKLLKFGPLNYNSEKVLYLLKYKVCDETRYVGTAKTKFKYRFNNYKSKHCAFRWGNCKIQKKLFHRHYYLVGHLGINDWDFETLGLHEKVEYLYCHATYMRVGQSVMKEFWLSFSFINFLIINLFKYVRQFLCVHIVGCLTYNVIGHGTFTLLQCLFFHLEVFHLLLSLFKALLSFITIITIITNVIIT